jgi:hypothetical protein
MKQAEPISICIPRVDINMPREQIYRKLHYSKICNIDTMTEIPLRNDPTHKRILMRIRLNKSNDIAMEIEKKLKTDGNIKFVYDMPWYWKIFLN